MMTLRFLPALTAVVLATATFGSRAASAQELDPLEVSDADSGDDETEDEVGAAPNIHGFLVARYMNADGKGAAYSSESQFDMQFVRVSVDGKAHPLVSYLIALELADVKVNSATPLRDAYVIWDPVGRWQRLRPYAPKLRLGRMRRPGGIEASMDENQLIAMDRSIYSGFLQHDDAESSEQDFRDYGVRLDAVLGFLELTGLGLMNGSAQQQTNSANPQDPDPHKDVMGRVGMNFTLAQLFVLRFGLSQLAGRDAATHLYSLTNDVPVYYSTTAIDFMMIFGRMMLLAEAARGTRTIDVPGIPGDTATGTAAYVLFSWGFGADGTVRPFARFAYRELSGNDNDDDFQRPRDWSNEATVGINVQIVKKALRARAQYTVRSGYIPPHPSTGGLPGFSKTLSGVAGVSVQADF